MVAYNQANHARWNWPPPLTPIVCWDKNNISNVLMPDRESTIWNRCHHRWRINRHIHFCYKAELSLEAVNDNRVVAKYILSLVSQGVIVYIRLIAKTMENHGLSMWWNRHNEAKMMFVPWAPVEENVGPDDTEWYLWDSFWRKAMLHDITVLKSWTVKAVYSRYSYIINV